MRMPILETERLRIRPFGLDDLEAAGRFLEYSDAERQAYLEWSAMNHQLLAWLDQPPYGDRGIELKASGELIGAVGYVPYLLPLQQLTALQDFPSQPETYCYTAAVGLYYVISPAHRRQGYASEATRGMIDYAFSTLRLDHIIATTGYNNLASQFVMRRLGMRVMQNPHSEPAWLQVIGVLKNDRC